MTASRGCITNTRKSSSREDARVLPRDEGYVTQRGNSSRYGLWAWWNYRERRYKRARYFAFLQLGDAHQYLIVIKHVTKITWRRSGFNNRRDALRTRLAVASNTDRSRVDVATRLYISNGPADGTMSCYVLDSRSRTRRTMLRNKTK